MHFDSIQILHYIPMDMNQLLENLTMVSKQSYQAIERNNQGTIALLESYYIFLEGMFDRDMAVQHIQH